MIEKANTLEDSHLEAGEGSYKKGSPRDLSTILESSATRPEPSSPNQS